MSPLKILGKKVAATKPHDCASCQYGEPNGGGSYVCTHPNPKDRLTVTQLEPVVVHSLVCVSYVKRDAG